MKRETLNKLMDILVGTSAALILIGSLFKLQHWAHGNQIMWIGFISFILLSTLEIGRLKKTIKKLEEKLPKA